MYFTDCTLGRDQVCKRDTICFCQHNEQARAFAAELAPRRAELLAILDQTPKFDERTRRAASSYMGEFFDQIGSASQVDEMLKTCLR